MSAHPSTIIPCNNHKTLKDETFLSNCLSGHLLCLLCYTARNSSPGQVTCHCLFLRDGKLRGSSSTSVLTQCWLTSSRQMSRAGTENFCCWSCCGLQSTAYQQREDNQFLLPGDGVCTLNLLLVSKAYLFKYMPNYIYQCLSEKGVQH